MATASNTGDFFYYQIEPTAPIEQRTYTIPYQGAFQWYSGNCTFKIEEKEKEMNGKIEGSREVKYKVKEGDKETEATRMEFPALMPQRIIISGGWTHCFFPDGTKQGKKVSVKFEGSPDEYSVETAVAECIAKYVFGTRSQFLKSLKKAYLQE